MTRFPRPASSNPVKPEPPNDSARVHSFGPVAAYRLNAADVRKIVTVSINDRLANLQLDITINISVISD